MSEEDVKIVLPKLGESILSATVVQWFKKVGDRVALDEPLLEVSTDKINSEIPSPVAGVLKKIVAHPDQELQIGDLLAIIATSDQEIVTPKDEPHVCEESEEIEEMRDFISPAVLKLAREKKIPLEELENIRGTGTAGRITKKDLEHYLENRKEAVEPLERVKMTGMRKAIAENMVRSFYEAPHAALINEIDVTKIMQYLKENKEAFLKKHGIKLSISAFMARAIARAVQAYPLINSSLEDDTIIVKRFVNLGIAVSVDQGVMVPVIKNCQNMDLPEIAKAIADLALKARTNKLAPDSVKDGTITMTNFGMTGTMIGIPIIRHPEVAIVGMGAIKRKVVALEDDSIAVRSIMTVSLTFDHRVLDGMYGCGFLAELTKQLEAV